MLLLMFINLIPILVRRRLSLTMQHSVPVMRSDKPRLALVHQQNNHKELLYVWFSWVN